MTLDNWHSQIQYIENSLSNFIKFYRNNKFQNLPKHVPNLTKTPLLLQMHYSSLVHEKTKVWDL